MSQDHNPRPFFSHQPDAMPLSEQFLPTPKTDDVYLQPASRHKPALKWQKPVAPPPAPAPRAQQPKTAGQTNSMTPEKMGTYTSLRLEKLYQAAPVIPRLNPSARPTAVPRPNALDRFTEHDYSMLALMARLMQKDF
jgi:hypothetical protein